MVVNKKNILLDSMILFVGCVLWIVLSFYSITSSQFSIVVYLYGLVTGFVVFYVVPKIFNLIQNVRFLLKMKKAMSNYVE